VKKSIRILASLVAALAATAAWAQDIQKQTQNEELRARLPQDIRDAGKMVAVNNGSFPPYEIVTGTELTGATNDISIAIGELLGITIDHASVAGLPALLSGIIPAATSSPWARWATIPTARRPMTSSTGRANMSSSPWRRAIRRASRRSMHLAASASQ
jgi:hypothetical protein